MKIEIPNPCPMNWDDMVENDKGRFCKVCQKNVIDFTQKSPLEIALFFRRKKDEAVCGKFLPKQIAKRTVLPIPSPMSYSRDYIAKILISSLLLLDISACNENDKGEIQIKHSQLNINTENVVTPPRNLDLLRLPIIDTKQSEGALGEFWVSDQLWIVGTIKDEDGNIIENATVSIPQLKTSIQSDEAGKYSFELPETTKGAYIIKVEKKGFQSVSAKLAESHYKDEMDNELDFVMKKK